MGGTSVVVTASSSDGTSSLDGDAVSAAYDQAAKAKTTFYNNMTSCLQKMTEEMSNQTAQQAEALKQQADALMMQYLDRETQIEMAKKHFSGATK